MIIEQDKAFENGFVVIDGGKYLTQDYDGEWVLTKTWALRWVFISSVEAEKAYSLLSTCVTYNY